MIRMTNSLEYQIGKVIKPMTRDGSFKVIIPEHSKPIVLSQSQNTGLKTGDRVELRITKTGHYVDFSTDYHR